MEAEGKDILWGEMISGLTKKYLIRRLTVNPLFEQMIGEMDTFLKIIEK